MQIDNQRNIKKKKKVKIQRKQNHGRSYEFRISEMLNQLSKWIKRQKKIINILDVQCQLASEFYQNPESNTISNKLEMNMADVKKYNYIIKFCQVQGESKIICQQLICYLDDCYFKKYWKQRNCLTDLFDVDIEFFRNKFRTAYNWYNKYNHHHEIFEALENIFIRLLEIGKENLRSLLTKYTTNFIIELLEQFREYYIFTIDATVDSSDRFLFINCLLHNFLIGYVNQELMYNPISIVNSLRIFSQKFQLEKLKNIKKCRSISKQTWEEFQWILLIQFDKWKKNILDILKYLFESQIYQQALQKMDESYQHIPYDFDQNIFCILIQELNIKGFIHKSGKFFINVYPVLKTFNLHMNLLFPILQAYCILVTIIAVNQHQILTRCQNYLIDVIKKKIIDINQYHLALFKQLFGVKKENSSQSNLDKLNYSCAILITEQIKKISSLEELQKIIITNNLNSQKDEKKFEFIQIFIQIFQIIKVESFSIQSLHQQTNLLILGLRFYILFLCKFNSGKLIDSPILVRVIEAKLSFHMEIRLRNQLLNREIY
ncbi:hypothetical protein pb186bvf_014740 [Paramecium bursaria]